MVVCTDGGDVGAARTRTRLSQACGEIGPSYRPGETVWEMELPKRQSGVPMTCLIRGKAVHGDGHDERARRTGRAGGPDAAVAADKTMKEAFEMEEPNPGSTTKQTGEPRIFELDDGSFAAEIPNNLKRQEGDVVVVRGTQEDIPAGIRLGKPIRELGNAVLHEFSPLLLIAGQEQNPGTFFVIGPENLLGQGPIARACLPDGTEMAVKLAKPGRRYPEFGHDVVVCEATLVPKIIRYGDEFAIRGSAANIREGKRIDATDGHWLRRPVIAGRRREKKRDGTVVHDVRPDRVELALDKLRNVAVEYASANSTNVLYYNGPIDAAGFARLVEACQRADSLPPHGREQRGALLILVTHGGLPADAYRCARYLRRTYRRFQVLIPGPCYSSGTLLAIGADEVFVSDHGELGPLDVQLLSEDKDEHRADSSAIIPSSLEAIQEGSYRMFSYGVTELYKFYSGLSLSTRSSIASNMSCNIFRSIASRIDPVELGRMHRHLNLCRQYGLRLAAQGGGVTPEGVDLLVHGYPDHAFVIDSQEAELIFQNWISHDLRGFPEIVNSIRRLDAPLRDPRRGCRVEVIATPRLE